MGVIAAIAAGAVTGVLSGWGVGGGTLLLIWLTAFAGAGQTEAQGINLVYFLPCALAALVQHVKNGLVDRRVFIPAAVSGVVFSALAAIAATAVDAGLLRRLFGAFLLVVGVSELFGK